MNLYSLLEVMDADLWFQVEQNHETVYKGLRDGFKDRAKYERYEVKAIWYSHPRNTLMIEI